MANKIYNFYTLSALSDKDNVRYVGVTVKTVEQRFYQHKYCAKNPKKRGLPVHKWMWSHYEKGDDIIVIQIDSCEESKWEQREQYWIKFYKDNGFDIDGLLLNKYPSKRHFDSIEGFSLNGVTRAIEDKSVYHDHYWATVENIDVSKYEPYFLYKEIDQENNIIEMYRTQTEICEKFNLNGSTVCTRIKKHKLFGKNYICKI